MLNTRKLNLTRALVGGLLLALAMLATTGCRTNLLPEYRQKIANTRVATLPPPGPEIRIDSQSSRNSIVEVVAAATTIGPLIEAQEKLAKVSVDPIRAAVGNGVAEELEPALGFAVTGEENHDTSLEIDILRYGLWAADVDRPLHFVFDVTARMYYEPEDKLIWEYHTVMNEPLSKFHITGEGGAQFAGTSINIAALNKLTTEQMELVLIQLADAASRELVAQMAADARK